MARGLPDSKHPARFSRNSRMPILIVNPSSRGRPDSLSVQSEVFVPLDIVRSAADHHDIQPAVAVDVDYLTSRCGHSHLVEDFVAPLGTFVILRIENMRTGDFPFGPIAGDDVIAAVAIEIAHADFVALLQLAED